MSFENIVTNTLTELLRSFQSAIAPLLELGKIEDWDGTELKNREEKIRELVIILAGKCIAIFEMVRIRTTSNSIGLVKDS